MKEMSEPNSLQKSQQVGDVIQGDTIILDGEGKFPKRLIIICQHGERREYRIIKTRKGGYILNS